MGLESPVKTKIFRLLRLATVAPIKIINRLRQVLKANRAYLLVMAIVG